MLSEIKITVRGNNWLEWAQSGSNIALFGDIWNLFQKQVDLKKGIDFPNEVSPVLQIEREGASSLKRMHSLKHEEKQKHWLLRQSFCASGSIGSLENNSIEKFTSVITPRKTFQKDFLIKLSIWSDKMCLSLLWSLMRKF